MRIYPFVLCECARVNVHVLGLWELRKQQEMLNICQQAFFGNVSINLSKNIYEPAI